MKKTPIEIGQCFGRLTVIGYEDSDSHGNQYVRVRCNCSENTEKRMRATALTLRPYEDKNGKLRLPHMSCGCKSKEAYREYWNKRARGIRKLIRQKIWNSYQKIRKFEPVSAEFQLPQPLIIAIVRRYNSDRRRRRRRRGR